MSHQIIISGNLPEPLGPYSHAVIAHGTAYISGQIAPPSPDTSIETETEQVLVSLQTVLAAAGLGLADVVKCSVFITDLADFSRINAVYSRFFETNPPARELVEVSRLLKGARIEISCIAAAAAASNPAGNAR